MAVKIFKNAFLLDCTGGDPLDGAWLATEGSVIKDIGMGAPASSRSAEIIDCHGLTLMPGLIDAHIHVSLFDNDLVEQHRKYHTTMFYVKALGVLKDTLDQGFTTVRDAGGADAGFRDAVESGLVDGPSITVCGRSISMTGGHADMRLSTENTPPSNAPFSAVVADGPDEVRRAAREELRRGADYLKIMAGGGCGSESDEPDTTQYSLGELRAIVEEADAVNKKTLAHCYSNNSMRRCAEAGVFSIEHGNFLDAPTAAYLKEKGCWLVPTLSTYFYMSEHGEENGMPSYFLRKVRFVLEHALDAVKIAVDAGLNIGSGSDVVGDGQKHKNLEIELKSRAMGAMNAILSATRENARLLGKQDKIGTLEAGKQADIILVASDPLKNPSAFADRENVKIIMKQGKLYKNIP